MQPSPVLTLRRADLPDLPTRRYFTPAGQLSGVGLAVYGSGYPELIRAGYAAPELWPAPTPAPRRAYLLAHGALLNGNRPSLPNSHSPIHPLWCGVAHLRRPRCYGGRYFIPSDGNGTAGGGKHLEITLSFRDPAVSCSTTALKEQLGDRIVINQARGGIAEELPLTVREAADSGWVEGSCFASMGTHWFRDLGTDSAMSWYGASLLPVVVMYDQQSDGADGTINAVFFASNNIQETLLPWPSNNQWEPVPLPNALMCKNFCDAKCTFHDTSAFSTLHLYFRDHTKVTCDGGCTIGCCKAAGGPASSHIRGRAPSDGAR